MEEIKKGKEYPYRVSERWEGKYSNKKGKIIMIKKWVKKAPRNKDQKEKKKRREKQKKKS